MKNFTKLFLLLFSALSFTVVVNAQTTGTVFRDFNGNGTRQTSAPNEPLVKGIIVNAYNSSDVLIASYTTTTAGTFSIPLTGSTYNGTPGSNSGSVANAVAVRLEFIIPATGTCGLNPNIDYSSGNGSTVGSSVRFVIGGTTAITYAINKPSDFVSSTNPMVYMSRHTNGNPLGGGTSGTSNWFVGFPYNTTGTGAPTLAVNGTTIGATWGIAYSKQAGKVFTSAFLKRHSGMGVLGSGGIYLLTPTATSFTVVNFYDMDAVANGGAYRTRADAAATPPAYGSGTSYFLTGSNTIINYLGSTDAASGKPVGMGVIGTNLNRGLPNANNVENWDPAAFDQVGKVGLGDLEISDDGKYLFSINLYDRKVYRLELNNAYNPTSVIAVTSYALPATTVTNGVLRPFGAKFYRGKLYVGAVATAENSGTAANLWAYVFELNNAASSPAFTATPVVNYALNYAKGSAMTWTGPYGLQWYPWSNNTTTTVGTGTNRTYPTPVLANIEFDDRGDMIMSFFDRGGHQWSEDNYQDLAVSTTLMRYAVGGDVLIAGSNCNGTFSIENNGAYTSANGSSYNSGAVNNQGPGTSEFFKGDNFGTTHSETSIGGLGFLPGSGELFFGTMDPLAINSGGVKRLSMATGLEIAGSGYQLAGGSIAGFGKAISLGDIEFFGTEPPIELGNRIWNDANGDGIQEPGEAGIGGVILELVDGSGNAVDSDPVTAGVQATFVTTDANGNWYLTSATGTDVTGINYGVALLPNTNYFLRLATSGTGNDWDPTANSGAGGPRAGGDLVNYQLTITDKVGTGAVDLSDNDGAMISSIPQVSIRTGDYGQNNHNIDFGFKQLASLGDRVWRDDDKDGIQDTGEPGVAGVTVTLYQNGSDGLPGTLDDVLVGTTITDAYGIYLFDNLAASTNAATSYNVGFTLPANYQFTTQTNTQVTGTSNATNTTTTSGGSTAANGSDASTTTGRTGSFWLAAGEAERGTDAGLIFSQPTTNSLGDKVWFDTDGDGVQDANEAGVSGVTVTLYASDGITVIATTITDAYGNYIFTGLPANTNYIVGITPPTGMLLTTSVGGTTPGNTTTNSDFNTGTYKTAVVNTGVAGTQITGIDAGLIQQTSTRASLGDKVWNDLNGNGIQEAGEPGIAGITVNLYRDSNGDGVISGSEASTPYATTVTDAFGNYIFNNLPASSGANGFYKVGFVAPSGYTLTTANAGSDETKDNDANTGTGLTGNYFLKAGERNLTVDAGLVQTSPAGTARLGDKVWFDANSNGTQDVGETGVAGVTVTLYNNVGTAIATTTTDANGNYQFVNLAAGDYSAGFSNLPAGYSFTPVWSSDDANATNSDANPGTGRTGTINLTAGESEQDVDAGLIAGVSSGLGSLGNKVWWDIVTANNVQDAGEPGVPGVTVNLDYDINGDGDFADAGETGYKTTTTNALGEYLFTGLSAGSYQVRFSNLPTGSNTVTQYSGVNDGIDSDGSTVTNATGASVSTTGVYNLAAGEDNLTVDLGLINTAKGSLGNRVWFDNGAGGGTANDGIQNGTESGVAGVMVTLVNAAGQPVDRAGTVLGAGASLITTTTDVNGYYAFGDLTAGVSFAVKFSNVPAGFDFTTKAGTGGGDDSRSDPNLASGLTPAVAIVANNFNNTLDAGITSLRAALGNYVWLDTDGDGIQDFDGTEPGVAGVTVTLYRPGFGLDGIGGNGDDALPVASMITDQNGQYLFSNLVAGTYEVEFSTIPTGISFTKQNTPGDNGDNTNSDAVPVPGNTSVARTAGITLSAGEVDLTVDAGLFKPRAVIGNYVWADSDNDGIQDANEIPASGILVSLIDGGGNVVAVAVTDANGGYLFPNVAPGTYSMSFTNLPTGTSFTTPNQTAGGGNDNNDSDVIGTTITGIVVTTTTVNLSFDAGIVGFIALPARLEFTAMKQGNAAKLSWKVTFEENVARYELEHSTDGITYTLINTQNRNGNAEYQYLDAQPASGINYYRVRIVDIDGRITFSEVRTILFGKGGQILVFPNPVRIGGQVNIQLPESWQNKKITFEIMNQLGQVISIQSRQQASQVETVAISTLIEGSYLLRMSSVNGEVETRKIMVKR